jgi:hypothetical protein
MKTKTPLLMLGIGLAVGVLVGYSLKDSTAHLPQHSADAFVLKDYVTAWNTNSAAREAATKSSDDKFLSYFPKEVVEQMDQQGFRVQWRIGEGKTVPSKSILFQRQDAPQLNSLDPFAAPHKGQKFDLIDLRYDPPQIEMR